MFEWLLNGGSVPPPALYSLFNLYDKIYPPAEINAKTAFPSKSALSNDGLVAVISHGYMYRMVSVYRRESKNSPWVHTQLLKPTTTNYQDRFGENVAVNGNGSIVVVALPGKPGSSIQIFELVAGSYIKTGTVSSQSEESNSSMGATISVTDDGVILATDPQHSEVDRYTSGSQSGQIIPGSERYGALHTISKVSGQWKTTKIMVNTASTSTYRIATRAYHSPDGEVMIAISMSGSDPKTSRGDIYNKSLGVLSTIPSVPDSNLNDPFATVSLSNTGEVIAIAVRAGINQQIMRVQVLFKIASNQWSAPVHIIPPEEALSGNFGSYLSVSPDGSRLFITQPGNQLAPNTTSGVVFMYERDGDNFLYTGTIFGELENSPNIAPDYSTLTGDELYIRDNGDDTMGVNYGAVLIFKPV